MAKLNIMAMQDILPLLPYVKSDFSIDYIHDIFRLSEKADCISDWGKEHNKTALLYPVCFGGLKFQSPTLAGMLWYDDHEHLFGSAKLARVGILMILHYDSKDLIVMSDQEIEKEMISFSKKVHINQDQMDILMSIYLKEKIGVSQKQDNPYGAFISFLIKQFGSTPHYWLHEISYNEISLLMDDYYSQIEHQIKKMEKTSKQKMVVNRDEWFQAIANYREILNEISERWKNGKQ